MEHCEGCGTKYVWQDVPDIEDAGGAGGDDLSVDSEPLFDQKAVECGYLDVEGGVFAFTGPTCSNRCQLSECQNCGTLFEMPAKACPLCGGALRTLNGNLTKLAAGVISGGGQDPGSAAKRSQMPHRGSERDLSKPLIGVLPSENIVFAHLDVGSGMMECLSEDGSPQSIPMGDEKLPDDVTAVDIGTFDRISLMFEEQASTIIKLTSEAPMTASEICRRMGVPRSVCYRKLKELTDAKLLALDRSGAAPGQWQVSRYQSNIDMAYVSLEHGDMNMLIRLKDSKETLIQRFRSEII